MNVSLLSYSILSLIPKVFLITECPKSPLYSNLLSKNRSNFLDILYLEENHKRVNIPETKYKIQNIILNKV